MRPFAAGGLVTRAPSAEDSAPLAEFGVTTWPQALIKYGLSHPATSVSIPATSKPDRMTENARAATVRGSVRRRRPSSSDSPADMPTSYHCELAWLGGDRAERDVLVRVDGERITAVEPGATGPAAGATRLAGLTVPGFANAHSHAFHRALRGRTQRGAGSFWTWREQMYAVAATLDPDRYHRLARATFAEMALAGVATVGEFHYLHHGPGGEPYADPNAMGAALIAAAAEAGIRLTLLDTCYLRGGIGVEVDETQRRFSDGDALGWAARASALADGPGVRIGAAIHSVRAVDPAAIEIVAAWAAERGAPLHAHVSEQPAENEQCLAAYGCSPTQLLADRAALSDRFTAVHGTHTSEADHTLLGAAAACAACARPPSAISPTASPRRGRSATPVSGSRWAATPTPSSTCSRRPGRSSSTSA